MIRSMTGYGSGRALLGELQIAVQLQSVNRRGLETGFSMPREWQDWESEMVEQIRRCCFRGKIQVVVDASQAENLQGLYWDSAALEDTLKRLQALAEGLNSPWPPDSDALIRLITLHRNEGGLPQTEAAQQVLNEAFSAALADFVAMREKEGKSLQDDLLARLALLRDRLQTVVEHSADSVERYRKLLFERLKNAGLEIDLDDERVLKEIALFADRCDITEEVTRLGSHFEQFESVIKNADGTEPVGRKLEFILQEINREFNTVGSKSNRIEISQAVIDAKNEIERIREQIQNVE
ncbi:MAG: YicC family protein [Opitutales bacterium]|nr:YicC family protein [Opitutales bacterium]